MLAEDRLSVLAEIFRLLGDPSRLKIILACFDGPKNVGEIASATLLSASLVSHHLRLLRAARLVRARRDGKRVFYEPADDHVRCVLTDMVNHVVEPDDHEPDSRHHSQEV